MSCSARLKDLLEKSGLPWQLIEHRDAARAEDVAQSSHVRARRLARVLLVRERPGSFAMLVLPASEHLDLDTARRVLGREKLALASPEEVRRVFPDCEPGAMPPFGKLYGLPTVLDLCFFEEGEEGEDGEIYFEAGNHHEVVAMRFADYLRLAGPFAHEACLHLRPRSEHPVKHGGRGAMAR